MKSRITTVGIALLAITMAFLLSGCEGPDPAQGPGNEADLLTLALGNLAVPGIPTRITMATWNNEERFLEAIEEEENTKIVPIPSGFNLSDAAITVTASKNAAAEYAVTADFYERPAAFVSIGTAAASLDFDSFLYIKITSEDKSRMQYYRFYIQDGENVAVSGITLGKSTATLTLFSSEQLTWNIEPFNATNKSVTWSSSDDAVAEVSPSGVVTAVNFSGNGPTGTATITVTTEDGGFTASIEVTTTTVAQVHMDQVPALKDLFADYFLIGNIFDPACVNSDGTEVTRPELLHHYNVLTAQNNMKPSFLSAAQLSAGEVVLHNTPNQQGVTNIQIADRMVNAALASGYQVMGHTILWHSQSATWMNNLRNANDANRLRAQELMEEWTHLVTDHYKGRLMGWDVLNEAFPDGVRATDNWRTSMRSGSSDGLMWYMALGADFVYDGFLAARKSDPGAVLYYNDYNLDQVGKATMVRDMVRDVNAQYMASADKQQRIAEGEDPDRLLIEGIGMQSHHNTGVSVNSIRASLELFEPLGVEVSITELDVLAQSSYAQFQSNQARTPQMMKTQAERYGEYFALFLEYHEIIPRVTFWGRRDGASWRNNGEPLPFDANSRAKPAYYKIIEALNKHQSQ